MGCVVFFFQAEDGIRVLVRSRGLGDVYKRQTAGYVAETAVAGGNAYSCAASEVFEGEFGFVFHLSLIHI